MKGTGIAFLVVLSYMILAQQSVGSFQESNWDILKRTWAPILISKAYQEGLLSEHEIVPETSINPYYVRGDFNGDGENDIAFHAKDQISGNLGLILIHSTLDTVYFFGPISQNHSDKNFFTGEYIRVLRKGAVIRELLYTETGSQFGPPIVLKTEALQAVYFAKSSGVYLWDQNGYRFISQSD